MPRISDAPRLRRFLAAAALAGAALMAAGCAPEEAPEPEPTEEGFANEEEALEAATETFERYVQAANSVDFSDPATAEPVYEWLVGDALASERDSLTTSHAEERTRSGEAVITLLELSSANPKDRSVELDACLDVGAVQISDSDGTSLVSPDRLPIQPMTVSLVASDVTDTRLAIATLTGREGRPACD